MYYKLDENNNPVTCGMEEFADFIKDPSKKIVGQFEIDEYQVSTVFLGLDHGFGSEKPILFETMIFGGKQKSEYCTRYATYQEAVDGHNDLVLKIMDGWKPEDDEEPWEEWDDEDDSCWE